MSCIIGLSEVNVLSAKRLLRESDKIRCMTSSFTSIKQRALLMATSSDVKTEECRGNVKERVSWPQINAQPTPSSVFDPSVKVKM